MLFTDAVCPRCDIVIIDIDIFRADALRCFEQGKSITPNLCRLVKRGTYFTNNFSQSYWTLPSSLSTYTSYYPNANAVWDIPDESLPSSRQTLSGVLRNHGYDTVYYGGSSDAFLSERNGGLRGYTHIYHENLDPSQWLNEFNMALKGSGPLLFHVYNGDLHMPYLLDHGEKPIVDMPKPEGLPLRESEYWPIWTHYITVHAREVFTQETIDQHPEIFQANLLDREKRIGDFFDELERQHDYTKRLEEWDTYYNSYMQFIDSTNAEHNAYLHMLYETKLAYLDTSIGPLISYLLQPKVADHTIIVLTSSHGEAFGEQGVYTNQLSPYNMLLHVPLVIAAPHMPARRISSVTENIDMYPTVLQLLGVHYASAIDGVSLVPLMQGLANEAKTFSISIDDDNVYIIQTKEYALITYKDKSKPTELYDMHEDPGELHNIASKHPSVVRSYLRLLINNAAPEFRLDIDTPLVPSGVDRKNLIRGGYF